MGCRASAGLHSLQGHGGVSVQYCQEARTEYGHCKTTAVGLRGHHSLCFGSLELNVDGADFHDKLVMRRSPVDKSVRGDVFEVLRMSGRRSDQLVRVMQTV